MFRYALGISYTLSLDPCIAFLAFKVPFLAAARIDISLSLYLHRRPPEKS